jgi:hypothetical protein
MARTPAPHLQPDALAALARRVEAANEARSGLRDDTRAAHEAAQELTAATRAAAGLLDGKALADRVEDALGEAVVEGLARYQAAVDKAIKDETDAVFRRFNAVVSALLGEDTDRPLEETLRRFRHRQQILEAGLAKAAGAAGVPVEDARLGRPGMPED